jgi:hypothetical protein
MTWQSDPQLESLLLLASKATHSVEVWKGVKEYLVASFTAFLGQNVEPVWEPLYEDISRTWGFAFGIRSRAALCGPLGLEWYGVISWNSGGSVSATMLLFAHDQRTIQIEGSEFLYFDFALSTDGQRRWLSRGWQSSEMNEWDGYLRLSEVCQQMRDTENARRTAQSERSD